MRQLLFPREACSLSSVEKVDFDFVSACEVLAAPEPVFDQPDIEIDLDFPPPPLDVDLPPVCIPCPRIGASATVNMTADSVAGVDVAVTALNSISSCQSAPDCEFMFDFNFRLPCAEVSATGELTYDVGSVTSYAPVTVAVTKIARPQLPGDPPNVCEYVFDFGFALEQAITQIVNNYIEINLDTSCFPSMVYFTLSGQLNAGSSAFATSTDGLIVVQDPGGYIPSGKRILSGASGWAWRTGCPGSYQYFLVAVNRCPTN